jgi:hypothetical protein
VGAARLRESEVSMSVRKSAPELPVTEMISKWRLPPVEDGIVYSDKVNELFPQFVP